MMGYDYEAVVYDSEVFCIGCLPDGIDADSDECHPIFVSSEWDNQPVCCECGEPVDVQLIPPRIIEGSTSTDSCRLIDIVNGIKFLSDADDKLSGLIDEFNALDPEITFDMSDADFIFEEICNRLDEIAPDNLTFGAHPNDGADYGFWNMED